MADKSKVTFAENTWLIYFNEVLFQKGIISETDRNKLKNMIACRKASASASKKK